LNEPIAEKKPMKQQHRLAKLNDTSAQPRKEKKSFWRKTQKTQIKNGGIFFSSSVANAVKVVEALKRS
jgi:hypothetical protein